MSQKLLLTCDICGKQVDQRKSTNLKSGDPAGDPAEIGGIRGGLYQDNRYGIIEFDLCEEHWKKVLEYTKSLKKG
jgi:hypothetical protein